MFKNLVTAIRLNRWLADLRSDVDFLLERIKILTEMPEYRSFLDKKAVLKRMSDASMSPFYSQRIDETVFDLDNAEPMFKEILFADTNAVLFYTEYKDIHYKLQSWRRFAFVKELKYGSTFILENGRKIFLSHGGEQAYSTKAGIVVIMNPNSYSKEQLDIMKSRARGVGDNPKVFLLVPHEEFLSGVFE